VRRGFTLLEVLVAIAIFAVISVLAYGGLTTVLQQRELVEARTGEWRDLQMAMQLVSRDLRQLHPRPVRDEIGDRYEPALLSRPGAAFALELTRGGWTNPGALPRSTLQRVAYRIEDGRLVRIYWPVLDRTLATEPLVTVLLDGVDALELRLLDRQGTWHGQWPPVGTDGDAALQTLPRAVEFALETERFGRVWRLLETSP
jgi:general secretion pathway protein J